MWNICLIAAAGSVEAGQFVGHTGTGTQEIQMGQIATVLDAAKPGRRAALEHKAVVVVHRTEQPTESDNDMGNHIISFRSGRGYTVPRHLPSDMRPIGHWRTTVRNSLTVRGQPTRQGLSTRP